MRIQIIEKDKQHYDAAQLYWFKETSDTWVSEYGAEKLDWLHAKTIDLSCDVFLEAISPAQVNIGWVCNDSQLSNTDQPLHWVTVTALDNTVLDALTQTLLATIGMNCIQSITGSFSVDWADVRTVLGHGTTAYCVVLDWNTPQQAIDQFKEATSQLQQPVDVVGCAMLLNQGFRIAHTYDNIQSLASANVIPADCLTITNMTNIRHIPQTNVLMFVCKNKTM
jgi:hypothetical protein